MPPPLHPAPADEALDPATPLARGSAVLTTAAQLGAGDEHAAWARQTGVAGVVLAAGSGTRLGLPKALLRLPDGRPLGRVTAQRLHQAGCSRVLVVVGARADEVVATLPTHEPWLRVAVAKGWSHGLGHSLRRGLDELEGTSASAALVALVDLPDLGVDVYRRVLGYAAPTNDVLARAAYRGFPGHPVVIGRDYWPSTRAVACGDRGARDLLAQRRHDMVECGDLATGRDVDTPADRARLRTTGR